jgi:hypothetical protein
MGQAGITRYRGRNSGSLKRALFRACEKRGWHLNEIAERKKGDGTYEKLFSISPCAYPSLRLKFYAGICAKGYIIADDMVFENLTVLLEWIKINLDVMTTRKGKQDENKRLAQKKVKESERYGV